MIAGRLIGMLLIYAPVLVIGMIRHGGDGPAARAMAQRAYNGYAVATWIVLGVILVLAAAGAGSSGSVSARAPGDVTGCATGMLNASGACVRFADELPPCYAGTPLGQACKP